MSERLPSQPNVATPESTSEILAADPESLSPEQHAQLTEFGENLSEVKSNDMTIADIDERVPGESQYYVHTKDEEIASLTSKDLASMTHEELAEKSGLAYSDILKNGKQEAIKIIAQNIAEQERQAAATAAAEKEAARSAREEKNQAKIEEQYAKNKAYNEERKERAAAAKKDEEIASLTSKDLASMTHEALAEKSGLNYGYLLRNGKEVAVKEAAQRIAERNGKAAAEKTRVIPVDTAAEQRSSELARLLKGHDRKVLSAQKERELREEEMNHPAIVTEEDLGKLDTSFPYAADNSPEAEKHDGTEQGEVDVLPDTEIVPTSMGEEVTESKPRRLKRMKKFLNNLSITGGFKVGQKIGEAKMRTSEWWSAKDRKGKYKVIGGAAATVVGVVTAQYVGNKVGIPIGGGSKAGLLEAGNALDSGSEVAAGSELGVGPELIETATSPADVFAEAVQDRANEILETEGALPWDKANNLYGSHATPRLMEVVETLREQGVDARWSKDPTIFNDAHIIIEGAADTDHVMRKAATELAKVDVENFVEQVT